MQHQEHKHVPHPIDVQSSSVGQTSLKGFDPTTASLKGKLASDMLVDLSLLMSVVFLQIAGTIGSVVPAVPAGLEVLIPTSHLVVKQCVELLEALSGYETANKYEILDTSGQRIFFAIEETNNCIVCCMRTRRCFKFKVTNYLGKPIFTIKRPCSCAWCFGAKMCCDLFGNLVTVTMADGTLLGTVKQTMACCSCRPKFDIRDAHKNTVLRIRGPKCSLCCCCRCRLKGTVEFSLFGKDSHDHQGVINKRWGGLLEEAFSDADSYGVTFDVNGDPKIKALVIAAAVLIDFMYFEDHNSDRKKAK